MLPPGKTMADSMEDAFSKIREVFAIETLNKHQEEAIKFVVEKKMMFLSICRWGLAIR